MKPQKSRCSSARLHRWFVSTHFLLALIAAATSAVANAHGTHGSHSHSAATVDAPSLESQLRALIDAHPELAAKLLAEHKSGTAGRTEAELATLALSLRPELESTVGGFAIGPASTAARVTVVDLFDYHCGPCKRATHDVLALAGEHKDVRFVFKELPVLSRESRVAASAALAARTQGRYVNFHTALMSAAGLLTEPRILAIAATTGIDVEKLRKDMTSPALQRELDLTIDLVESLGLKGTPTFLVNGQLLVGRDAQRLRQMIEKARDALPQ